MGSGVSYSSPKEYQRTLYNTVTSSCGSWFKIKWIIYSVPSLVLVDVGCYSGCTALSPDINSVLERVITPGLSSVSYSVTIHLFGRILRLLSKESTEASVTVVSVLLQSGANTIQSNVTRYFTLFYLRMTQVL